MAHSSEIDGELAALRPQRDTLLASMDALMPACCEELVEAAGHWINSEVARQVSDHARQVSEMGLEKAKVVKAQVADLIAKLPRIVSEATSDPATWPHRGAKQEVRNREPYFSAVFRATISNLGSILDSAGFLASPGHFSIWVCMPHSPPILLVFCHLPSRSSSPPGLEQGAQPRER